MTGSELVIYLLKVNLAVMLFFLVYHLLLRRLTFYTLNRVYLQFGLLFSAIYPLIDFRRWFAPQEEFSLVVQYIIPDWETAPGAAGVDGVFSFWGFIGLAFWLTAGYFMVRLLLRLFSLWQIHRGSVPATWHFFRYRYVGSPISPFSFWQNIYVHTDGREDRELYEIFNHEQVHVDQLHTLDTLLAEFFILISWFNPFGWLMRDAVRQNLEFITDREVIRSGVDKRMYQYSLLNFCQAGNRQKGDPRIGVGNEAQGITTNFNFKHLKTRIMMMNKKQSSMTHLGRYVFAIPGVVVPALILTLAFTRSQAGEQPLRIIDAARPDAVAVPLNVVVELGDSSKHSTKAIIRSATGKRDTVQPLILLDGTRLSAGTSLHDLDVNTITSVTVLKDQAARAMYGEDARDGVIIITTGEHTPPDEAPATELGTDTAVFLEEKVQTIIRQGKQDLSENNPLILIDGVEGDLSLLSPDRIKSVTILKDGPELVRIYGPAAINGVVLVETKSKN